MSDPTTEDTALHAWAETLARTSSRDTLATSLAVAVAPFWSRLGVLLGDNARNHVIERACHIAATQNPNLSCLTVKRQGIAFDDFALAASALRVADRTAAVRVLF